METVAWSPDSKTIYFTSENKGEAPIYRLDVDAANAPPSAARIRANAIQEIARGVNDDLSITSDGKTLVFSRLSAQAPNEVYKIDLDSKKVEELSHLNDAVLAKVAMQPVESFWFAGAGGTKIQGFLVKPPNFNKDNKYPVKF